MFASIVSAQSPPSDQPTSYVSGTVVSSTGSSIMIRAESGAEMTFTVDSRSILPADLPVGSRVDISYHTLPDGKLHAAEVRSIGRPAARSEGATLPKTASPLAMTALVGLASLVVASGLWLVSRRYA